MDASSKSARVGAIILARLTSSRLPGKALMEVAGKPLLTYTIERLLRVLNPHHICLATSTFPSDDALVDFAKKSGILSFRGSMDNVAERFFQAACEMNWDYAIRINGDNIFVDSILLKSMVERIATGNYDFVSNVKGRTFPKGMSIEIVRVAYYAGMMNEITKLPTHREHVTSYLYEHPGTGRHWHEVNTSVAGAAGVQLAVDTAEDLERTRRLLGAFTKPHWMYNLREIINLLGNDERQQLPG